MNDHKYRNGPESTMLRPSARVLPTQTSSSSIRIKQCAAFLLLVLLCLSFVLENQMIVGGEISELVEGSEKEENIKEKNFFYVDHLPDHTIEDLYLFDKNKEIDRLLSSGLFLEVSTPPPECI